MEYRFSYVMDPSDYRTDGLCDGISVRNHRNAAVGDLGIIRLHKEWSEYIGPPPTSASCGGLGPQYSFTPVTLPECFPERLGIVSYAIEFAFVHDDVVDPPGKANQDDLTYKLVNAFHEDLNGGSKSSSGGKPMQSRMVQQMMVMDPKTTMSLMRCWAKYLKYGGDNRQRTKFDDFEDYVEHRIMDCGSWFLTGLSLFAMGLVVQEEEEELCHKLARPVWGAASLTNDLQSWDKEYKVAQAHDNHDLRNAIWLLMKQHSIDAETAKQQCCQRIKAFVGEYVQTLEYNKVRQDISEPVRIFVEAMQYMLSGNLIWGWQCPRYNPDCKPNQLQLATMKALGYPFSSPPELLHRLNDPGVVLRRDLPTLSKAIIDGPSHYIDSHPSKGIRERTIDAINLWFQVPEQDLTVIKNACRLLHGASLMLDDIEDSSKFRRGQASTHTVFGSAQTINSAGYRVNEALKEVSKLDGPECTRIFYEEMENLYIGQSYDLFWTFSLTCPSVEEYMKMVDYKTAGLFRMVSRLMQARSTSITKPDLTNLMTLLGRYFQIRDDYLNLTSIDYAQQKGFCEDLDEGKYSLMLIHAMQTQPEKNVLLRNILAQRRKKGRISDDHKRIVLEQLKQSGSMDFTLVALRKLQAEIDKEVKAVAQDCGTKNPLESLLGVLEV